jgi:hypothetical protein
MIILSYPNEIPMQRNQVFVSVPRVTTSAVTVKRDEWLFVQGKLDGKPLENKTRLKLLAATQLYASSFRSKETVESLGPILGKIKVWERQTKSLTNYIWKKDSNAKDDLIDWMGRIENGKASLEDVRARYLCAPPTEQEDQFALAALDRIATGAILVANLLRKDLVENVAASDARNLWFLWAALVFSILGEDGHRLKHPSRKNLEGGPVLLLAKLQSKLPVGLQLRNQNKMESFRKGAVIAYKIRRNNPTKRLNAILTRWVNADFRGSTTMHEAVKGRYV